MNSSPAIERQDWMGVRDGARLTLIQYTGNDTRRRDAILHQFAIGDIQGRARLQAHWIRYHSMFRRDQGTWIFCPDYPRKSQGKRHGGFRYSHGPRSDQHYPHCLIEHSPFHPVPPFQMNAQFKATNPDQIPFTMEVTLSLKGWKTLKDNIGPLSSYETGEVYDAIGKMISQAERTYYPEVVEK